MKLIIDIPDTTYAFVKQLQWISTGRGNCKTIQHTVINAIKFGVKQPQGKWIFNKEMSVTCSLWNCSVCNRLNGNDSFNFCPNCGADMRGENGK